MDPIRSDAFLKDNLLDFALTLIDELGEEMYSHADEFASNAHEERYRIVIYKMQLKAQARRLAQSSS